MPITLPRPDRDATGLPPELSAIMPHPMTRPGGAQPGMGGWGGQAINPMVFNPLNLPDEIRPGGPGVGGRGMFDLLDRAGGAPGAPRPQGAEGQLGAILRQIAEGRLNGVAGIQDRLGGLDQAPQWQRPAPGADPFADAVGRMAGRIPGGVAPLPPPGGGGPGMPPMARMPQMMPPPRLPARGRFEQQMGFGGQ